MIDVTTWPLRNIVSGAVSSNLWSMSTLRGPRDHFHLLPLCEWDISCCKVLIFQFFMIYKLQKTIYFGFYEREASKSTFEHHWSYWSLISTTGGPRMFTSLPPMPILQIFHWKGRGAITPFVLFPCIHLCLTYPEDSRFPILSLKSYQISLSWSLT